MWHQGGGVRHNSARNATKDLLNDREALDLQPFILEHDHNPEENDTDVSMEESDDKSSGEDSRGSCYGTRIRPHLFHCPFASIVHLPPLSSDCPFTFTILIMFFPDTYQYTIW